MLVGRRSGLAMRTFALVAVLILCGGGLGGFASYLLEPREKEARRFWEGGVRRIMAGAIVALTVPLFLSLAKGSLIESLFAATDHSFPNALVLIGFCVVAGFASRKFIDSLASTMMLTQRVQENKEKIEHLEHRQETSEEAVELVEEGVDKVRRGGDEAPAKVETVKPAKMNAHIEALAATLGPEERAVLNAAALHERTLTGISRDANLPRKMVKKIVPKLVQRGVLQDTISANTFGRRVAITPIGAALLQSPVTYLDTSPSAADAADTQDETRGDSDVKSGN
jgi:hypothetical protein